MPVEIKLAELKSRLKGCFIVVDSAVHKLYRDYLPADITCIINGGESAKSLATAEKILSEMLKRGIKRNGCVAAIGGGTVLDLTGFAASVYMRGIRWINIPTTVLSMADSSIGGKTGLNLGGIKNIIGSFWQPAESFYCYDFLKSLSTDDIYDGFAEIVKTSLLNTELFNLVFDKTYDCADIDSLIPLIKKAAAVKEKIVKGDYLDNGARQNLNMGHTVGHALEAVYGISHGQSVALGLLIEVAMFKKTAPRLEEYLKALLTPILKDMHLLTAFDTKAVAAAMISDKKNKTEISFVVPVEVGKVEAIEISKQELLAKLNRYTAVTV